MSPFGRQRSVLVVGGDLTAVATAGFLQQVGVDPVLAAPADSATGGRRPPTDATAVGPIVLWRPGLALLERLGLRRPIERLGTPLTRLESLTDGRSWSTDELHRHALVAINAETLGPVIETYLRDGIRETARSVTATESTDNGVRARFTGGIEELFDVVVTTVPSLGGDGRQQQPSTGLHSWAVRWPSGVPTPPAPAETWSEDRAAVVTPDSDRCSVTLLSAVDSTAANALSIPELADRFGELFASRMNPFAELAQQQLQYKRLRQACPVTLSEGGIVRAGSAARRSVPGDCLAATLGLEDAWVIADSLGYGPDGIETALAEYDRRRRQREAALAEAIADFDTDCCDQPRSPSLRTLKARRRLAFCHVRCGHSALATAIPQQL